MARYLGVQFIIATHSPFMLGILNAKIYNLDTKDYKVQKWSELENVRYFYDFFKNRKNEFEKQNRRRDKVSKMLKVNKTVTLKFEDRKINLPNELKENIEKFWEEAIKRNPNLYNGEDYAVEKVTETEENIEMLVVKSNYAHYLYDERIGIEEEKYRCCSPWGGILLITKDDYFVIGEMDSTTSIPHCLQISGGRHRYRRY